MVSHILHKDGEAKPRVRYISKFSRPKIVLFHKTKVTVEETRPGFESTVGLITFAGGKFLVKYKKGRQAIK